MQLISLEIRILICYKMKWIKLINYWKFRCLKRMFSKRVKLKIWSFCFFIILRKTDDCKEFFLEFFDLSFLSLSFLISFSSFEFLCVLHLSFCKSNSLPFCGKRLVKGNEFLVLNYGITTDFPESLAWAAWCGRHQLPIWIDTEL